MGRGQVGAGEVVAVDWYGTEGGAEGGKEEESEREEEEVGEEEMHGMHGVRREARRVRVGFFRS